MEYAIVSMAGIFPNAKNIDEYWTNIINANISKPVSLKDLWKDNYNQYSEKHNINIVYSDKGYCLPDDLKLPSVMESGRQIELAKLVLDQLDQALIRDHDRTALVLGTSWSDLDYLNKDIDSLLHKVSREIVYSPEQQIKTLVEYLNIKGPAFAVDAACAASLYAIDNAIGLLAHGLADSVIVLGISASLPYYIYSGFSHLGALSTSGEIRPFSKDACGLVLGEGAGAIVIEELATALENKREVLAVIRSTGLSSNGSERSVFAPGYNGQMMALDKAYKNFDNVKLSYIETHGTATKLGDETEVKVLKDFVRKRNLGERIPIGSVKSLIGHGLAAAGIASIIKAVLIINNKLIPPYINVPQIHALDDGLLYLPSEAEDISGSDEINIGVSSFGFGGANAHILLSSFQASEPRKELLSNSTNLISVLTEPLAIIDGISARDCFEGLMKQGQFVDRFNIYNNVKWFENMNIQGEFFPDYLEIDTSELRLGPKLMSKIDPFQAITIYLASLLLKNKVIDLKAMGAVICGNMGGTMALKQFRKAYLELNIDKINIDNITIPAKELIKDEVIYDEIASSIPSLLSGFQARNFNNKAFHQTLAGDEQVFMNMLLLSEYWLSTHCEFLLLGAGYMIKSPVDMQNISSDTELTIQENMSLLLLTNLSKAKQDNLEIAGCIKAIVMGDAALEEICHCAQILPEEITKIEKCSVNSISHEYASEATGIMNIVSHLKSEDGMLCLQFSREEKILMSVFISSYNCMQDFSSLNAKPVKKLPIRVYFNQNALYSGIENENHIVNKDINNDLGAMGLDIIGTSEAMLDIALSTIRHNRIFIETLFDKASEPNKERFISLFNNKRNIVINLDTVSFDDGIGSGILIVDETHKFYYDHELDHVSGFLLLSGILQMVKLDSMTNSEEEKKYYCKKLKINFLDFGEKTIPIKIILHRKKKTGQTVQYYVLVYQGEKIISQADIQIQYYKDDEIIASLVQDSKESRPKVSKELVHKVYKDNIVVSDIYTNADSNICCRSLIPEKSHTLLDGEDTTYSILHILELTRQFLTQAIHLHGVSYETKQILTNIDIEMNCPISNDTCVIIEYESNNNFGSDRATTQAKVNYFCENISVGSALYSAQIVDKQQYQYLRGRGNYVKK